tara:strand:- start:12479 stop:13399 length:921 start_codon:yes stop_codon:yes gene_type:complete
MAYLSQYQYYENAGVSPTDANWGSYQYVPLTDVVNNFLLMYSGNHSLVNNEERYKILFHAKRGIQELNYDAFKEIKALEMKVFDDLKFILPSDYVNWVRISLYKDGYLRPLTENIQVNAAASYLQSASGSLSFNADGTIQTTTSTLDTQRVDGSQQSIYLNQNNSNDASDIASENPDAWKDYNIGARYGLNTETANFNPTFRIDKKSGVINFDSTMANEQCILEYIADGMEGGNDSLVSVNKLFEDFLYAYIKYEILNNKFGVQEYIINRARKDKSSLLRNAKIRISNIHPGRLLMNLRGENKWIK